MVAPGRRRVERDVFGAALARHVRGHSVSRWGPAVVPQTDEQDAERLRHQRTIQPVGAKRRKRRLLLTTNTLDEAMAALATIGDSSHDIANGIAATL